MKYKLYRSFGNLDKDVRRHELVAVEYGMNLEAVTNALIRAVADDLAGTPEYANYETAAFAPEPVKGFRRVRRYDYEMTGIVYPTYADKNILIDYGIINLPHHVSKTRPQMSMLERAAQFSPFAALNGYDDAVKETGRLTDERIELEMKNETCWIGSSSISKRLLLIGRRLPLPFRPRREEVRRFLYRHHWQPKTS